MNNNAKRASIILGVFMAVVLIGSTFLQLLNPNSSTVATVAPTQRVDPTFPAPLDTAGITYDEMYLHPSGIFAVAQPTGYAASQPSSQPNIAQINMVNNEALSVIDAFVQNPGTQVTADDLDGYFTEEVLDQSWSNFQNWSETTRRRNGDTLVIDFTVRFSNQDYVARQIARTDGEWIYVTRVLAPSNATNFLITVLENVNNSMTPFKQFAGQPFNWEIYLDPATNIAIRHPAEWLVTNSAPGSPASIAGSNGENLRVETQTGNILNDEAAENWVLSTRPNATILSVAQGESGTYTVAYAYATADGDPMSGFAALMNGENNQLYTANLRFAGENIDLNSYAPTAAAPEAEAEATPDAEATPEAVDPDTAYYESLAVIMSSFGLMPQMTFSADSMPPTATPLPTRTVAPTAEATAESTVEATEAPEAAEEATVEPAEEATAESTVEATEAAEEATVEPTEEATPES